MDMAGLFKGLRSDKTKDTPRSALFFDDYLEAYAEASRRRTRDADSGMISRVEKSPYGGYVIRSWPIEILADPDMRRVGRILGGVPYEDL